MDVFDSVSYVEVRPRRNLDGCPLADLVPMILEMARLFVMDGHPSFFQVSREPARRNELGSI